MVDFGLFNYCTRFQFQAFTTADKDPLQGNIQITLFLLYVQLTSSSFSFSIVAIGLVHDDVTY